MAGWKEIRGVIMCPGPCCNGYEERVMDLPLLQRSTVCHKLTKEEIAQRQNLEALMKEKLIANKTQTVNAVPLIPSGKWKGRADIQLVDSQASSVTKVNSAGKTPKEVSEDEVCKVWQSIMQR